MDQLMCASLSHTHYWFEVGVLKVPANVLVANPKKLLYTVANPACDLLNRERRTEKVWQRNPPRHSFGENKIKIT